MDRYHGLTITEILDENDGALGARMTVWKKAKRLLNAGYINKGVVDDHADTYYLLELGVKTVELKGEV